MTEQAQGQPTPEAPVTPNQDAEARTLTWEEHTRELQRVGKKEKGEGRQSRDKDLLEKTGAESIDEILSIYEAHKLTQAEMETATEKAEKAKAKAEERAQAAEERYTNTLRDFALREALRDAGVQSESLGFVMRGIDKSTLTVDTDGNVSGVEDAVSAAQEEAPMLFGGQERPRINAPQTQGTGVQTPTNGGMTPEEAHANWLLSMFDNSR